MPKLTLEELKQFIALYSYDSENCQYDVDRVIHLLQVSGFLNLDRIAAAKVPEASDGE